MNEKIDYYMNLKYMITIDEIEDESETFFKLSHIDLPGLEIYADSLEEGMKDLEDAKKEWFAAAIKSGINIPLPKEYSDSSGRVTLRMTKSLHEEVKIKSELENVSLNAYLNQLINDGLRGQLLEKKTEKMNTFSNKIEGSVSTFAILANLVSNNRNYKNTAEEYTFTIEEKSNHYVNNDSKDSKIIPLKVSSNH